MSYNSIHYNFLVYKTEPAFPLEFVLKSLISLDVCKNYSTFDSTINPWDNSKETDPNECWIKSYFHHFEIQIIFLDVWAHQFLPLYSTKILVLTDSISWVTVFQKSISDTINPFEP